MPLLHTHTASPSFGSAALSARYAAEPRTILLVDDHPLFRLGLASILGDRIGGVPLRLREAATVVAAIDVLAEGGSADLIVYDWHLPGGGGVRGLVSICQLAPAVPVLVISADEDEAIQIAALRVGAAAFMTKAADPASIRELIRRHLQRDDGGAAAPAATQRADAPASPCLTPRQHAVLRLMAQGHGNKDIARRLDIAENTVRSHVSEVLRAFSAANRTEAVFKAGRVGFVDTGADAAGFAASAAWR